MGRTDEVERGREAYQRQDWADAYALLAAADQDSPLEAEDLERLAAAAYLIGRDSESEEAWSRAHQEYQTQGDTERSVRCAFWLAFGLLNKGERARASGWLARAQRLLDEGQRDCVERGYLLLPAAFKHIVEGDNTTAYTLFTQAGEIGDRFGDPDLVGLARHSRGRAL